MSCEAKEDGFSRHPDAGEEVACNHLESDHPHRAAQDAHRLCGGSDESGVVSEGEDHPLCCCFAEDEDGSHNAGGADGGELECS